MRLPAGGAYVGQHAASAPTGTDQGKRVRYAMVARWAARTAAARRAARTAAARTAAGRTAAGHMAAGWAAGRWAAGPPGTAAGH